MQSKSLKRWLDALVKGSPYRAVFIEERPDSGKGAKPKSLAEVFRESLVKRTLAIAHEDWQYPSPKYGVGQPKPERVARVREELLNDPVLAKQLDLIRRFTDREYLKALYELNLPRR